MGNRCHNSSVLLMIYGTAYLLQRNYRPHLTVLQQLGYYVRGHMIFSVDFLISADFSVYRLTVDSCSPYYELT